MSTIERAMDKFEIVGQQSVRARNVDEAVQKRNQAKADAHERWMSDACSTWNMRAVAGKAVLTRFR